MHQAPNADNAYKSFYNKKFFPASNMPTIADGLRTSLGDITYKLSK
jgi:threonine dehydratase/serine racemase